MVKCPVCQRKNPESTLYCDECGAHLQGGNGREAAPLTAAEVPGGEVTFPLGLKLTVPDSGRSLEVPLTREVNIGRLDPVSGSFPDVDLSGEGGLNKAVSRRHAQISRRGSEVRVEDLGSMNGTFLNRRRLTPYLPQVLKSGDELQLGELTLRVSFT
jgi:pSer/pThr/pTyr-binding forkhead associated (FHA) protein